MKNYFTKKKIDANIKNLNEEKKELRMKLDLICKELHECYEKKAIIENLGSAKIKFGDLLEELKIVTGYDITNIELYALEFFAKSDDIEKINENMKFFGNKLCITFDNDYCLTYYFRHGSEIFNNLNDIQADGKTLLEHCSFENDNRDLMVNKDIENVICCFNLSKDLNCLDCIKIDKYEVLEQAVYSLIEKNKVIEIEPIEKEAKTKQKTIGIR